MASRRNRLWATTKYGPYLIKIYVNPRMVSSFAETSEVTGGAKIELAESLLTDPVQLDETLIHEFVHVLEYLNLEPAFSTKTVNNCTALAQTVGRGLAQMLRELALVPRRKQTRRKSKDT